MRLVDLSDFGRPIVLNVSRLVSIEQLCGADEVAVHLDGGSYVFEPRGAESAEELMRAIAARMLHPLMEQGESR